jgi:ABC-type branched-subunit amino acid transport system permease subunit
MKQKIGFLIWILGTSLLFFGPSLLGPYGSLLLWSVCQQAVLALSYSFLGGMGRELHLGHGVFFGLGAYMSAILLQAGLPWWLALPAAGTAGALLSKGLAPFLVRLSGGDFAVASLCVALLAGVLARNLEEFTGGVAGISVPAIPREVPYFCSLVLLGGALLIHRRLIHSSWGRAIRATGMDSTAALHLGVPGKSLRTQALLLGSSLAALAGGIYPLQSGYLSPESAFGLEVLLSPVVAVLLGGSASSWGPLWGAALLAILQELILTGLPGTTPLAMGLFLMVSGLRAAKELPGWQNSKELFAFRHSKGDAS